MIKNWNKFNESSSESNDISKNLEDIFKQEVEIKITLENLLKDNNFLILTKDGKIYEFVSGKVKKVWLSDEEFKDKTGSSINDEYVGNKSEEFLNFIKNINYEEYPDSFEYADYYEIVDEIEGVYFEGKPSDILKSILSLN